MKEKLPVLLREVGHVLADCKIARELLGEVSLQITCPVTPIFIFKEWMLECVNWVSLQQFEKFMVFLWALWNDRNAAVWEDRPRLPADIAIATMSWFNEYKLVHASSIPGVKVIQRWTSPAEHVLKCNIGDHKGDFQAALTKIVSNAASAFQVELIALQAAVQFAISLHHEQVQFETDCLQLVQVITAADEDASIVGHIVDEGRLMFRNYPLFSPSHVTRRANNIAHTLAQMDLHSELSHSWFFYAPEFIRNSSLIQ
ncbi:putative ribonuclease H-like domain-containing protein [Rosa chinensis]|uniref:Putative ribonuclease H-like domain-containing protein n=1 Tax=Rosa chinensis TaxID=74649 RepID=A0A2P6RBC4_ROSCH|nr:putative ribonuclease H-like domain-containing protein [Rosa chinensis]